MATRLAHEPAERDALRSQLATADRIAIDTEFHAERRYVPELFLVQVQVPGADAWIIDPLVDGALEDLAEALVAVPWIVHGGSQDVRLLSRALGSIPDEVLDTQIGSGLCGPRFPQGYGALVQEHLGITLPKAATLSDWSKRPLSPQQLDYAIDDVTRLHALWGAIEKRLIARDRLEIARQACREAALAAVGPPDPVDAWRRFGAAEGMRPNQLAVLREVAGWREATAQANNVPPRAVLSDGIVVELAKRPPPDGDRILANRRFPRGARKHVPDLVECVRRGLAIAESDAPRCVHRYSGPWRTAATLKAWALTQGHDDQWASSLVLPDRLIGDLALSRPSGRSDLAEQLGPWRDALLGDALWELLSGRLVLAIDAGAVRIGSPQA